MSSSGNQFADDLAVVTEVLLYQVAAICNMMRIIMVIIYVDILKCISIIMCVDCRNSLYIATHYAIRCA